MSFCKAARLLSFVAFVKSGVRASYNPERFIIANSGISVLAAIF